MNINMNFATRAAAALSLGTLLATTACTDYAQEFKDDENNKIYAEGDSPSSEDPKDSPSSEDPKESVEYKTPLYEFDDEDFVIWHGYDGEYIKLTTDYGHDLGIAYLCSDEDSGCIFNENALLFDGSSIDTMYSGGAGTFSSIESLEKRIRYYGGLGGTISTDGHNGDVYLIFPLFDVDLSDYNMIRITYASDMHIFPQMAKIDENMSIIETSGEIEDYTSGEIDYTEEGVQTLYTNILVKAITNDGWHWRKVTPKDMSKYNAVVVKLGYSNFAEVNGYVGANYNIIGIALANDPSERDDHNCSIDRLNAGFCFHWSGIESYTVDFGTSSNNRIAMWKENNEGRAVVNWPTGEALSDTYEAVIDQCDGICGEFRNLDDYTDYVSLELDITEQKYADVFKWGGLCVTYSSNVPVEIYLQSDDDTNNSLNMFYPMTRIEASTEKIGVDLSWSVFAQEEWAKDLITKKMNGFQISSILKRIQIYFDKDQATRGEFHIYELGSLGTCSSN